MKCKQCNSYKKANNCQKCFLELKNDYWYFLNKIIDVTNTIHLSTLDKIKKLMLNKKEQIRNFENREDRIQQYIEGIK